MIINYIVRQKKICRCLQAFSTKEILKLHIKNSSKINCKQGIIMPKKVEYVTFKNRERKKNQNL